MLGAIKMVVAVMLAVLMVGGLGCGASTAARSVVIQNEANATAQAGNVAALADLTRTLARAQLDLQVRAARERVASDLARVRIAMTPEQPGEADFASGTPWARSLDERSERLRAKLASVPPERVEIVAEELSREDAGAIDIALRQPGMTVPRVLRDAAMLDDLNVRIESEPSASLRDVLHGQRDALLDAYFVVQRAVGIRTATLAALDDAISVITEQGRVAQVHASAMVRAAQSPEMSAGAIASDMDLHAAIVGLVRQARGDAAAEAIGRRLAGVRDVIATASP